MAVICVNTSSPDFKRLLEKTSFSEGTLKSIIHEYQNTPSLWEAGQGMWPSDDYVMNYFNRKFIGSPAQIAVWQGRFMSPHIYATYQEASAEKQEASKWFNPEFIYVRQNQAGNWVLTVARPLDIKTIKKNSDTWLRDLQKDIDSTVNTGAYGRYIPRKNEPWKNVPAMDYLGKRLDNFYRQRGLKVQAYWSKNSQKWMVKYAPEEKGYVDDINGGMFDWNEGQKQAIETISNFINDPKSGNYIRLVAKAGSGKTSIINAILEKVNTGAGKPTVIVGALSHKAKSVIESKIDKKARQKFNIEAKTIAGMLGMTMKHDNQGNEYFEVDKYARRMGIPIQSAKIVFIDEASMVSEEAMHFIDEMINWGTKVVFIGDNGQLPPIRSTQSPFYQKNTALLDQNADSPVFTKEMPEVRLTERVRQGEDSPLHAVADLFWNYSQGVSKVAPDISKTPSSADNRLIIETGDADLVAQMLPLFKRGMDEQNPNVAKIVSFTNAVVNAFNARIHRELHPEMGDDMNFAKGDLITLYDSYSVGVTPVAYNSEEGIVISADNSYTSTFYTPSGKEVSFMIRNLDVKMADGRTITLPVLEQSAENIARYNAALNMAKAEHDADRWQSFYRIKNSVADLRFGYASTIHKSQGSTYEVVGVNTTDAFGLNKFRAQGIYTALTRASNISIVRGMNSQNAAPTAETITQVNTKENERRSGKKKSLADVLSPEQKAFIDSEVDGVAKIIKDAAVTIARVNLSRAESRVVRNINDYSDGDTATASSVVKAIIDSPNATAQQKAYAKALMPLLSKMDFNILFATESNPVVQETLKRNGKEHWNAAGSTFPSREAGGGYDIHIKIDVHKNEVIPEKVLLHEITHAFTTNRLRNDAEFRRAIDQLSQYVQEWVRTNKDATQMMAQRYGDFNIPFDIYAFRKYADSGYADFLTEAMSNASFQELLKQIPAPEETQLSTWQKICKLVADAFKSLFSSYYKQGTTVYDLLIPVIADTMTLTSEQYSRNAPYTEWETDRTVQMMANAAEIVKAMNVAIEDKDVHWTTEQVMELFGEPAQGSAISNLFTPNGEINWDYYESILDAYMNKQPDEMFAHGRYTLATRPENHFAEEKNTLNHIKFVTKSMLDLLEGKYDMDLPFVSEARASLRNQRDLMIIAAMFHDAAKPYRHGDIHGWESADILRDILGVDYNNRVAEWAVRHHMPMPFSHKAQFSLTNPEAIEVAKNIARDARRIGIDAQTAINAFVLINAADIINGREITVDDNWAKKAQAQGDNRYGEDISVKNVLSIELKEKVDLLKKAFEEIKDEYFGDTEYNYKNQERFDYKAFPEGGRPDRQLPYLRNQQSVQSSSSTGGNRTVVKKGDTIKITTIEGRTFNAKIVDISPRINGFSLQYTDPADGFTRIIESDINGNPVDFSAKHYASITDTNNNPIKLLETPKVEPTKEELFKEALKDTLDRINWLEGQIGWVDTRIRYNQATSEDYNSKEEWERKLASEQALVDAAQNGKAEVFVNEHGTPFLRVLPEKPAPNIVVEDVFNFTETESQKEGYSKAVIISKKNIQATAKDGAAQMQRLIEQDRWPAGTQIIPRGLNNSELAALNRVKNLNKNEDGSWTVYYTEREMGLKRQNDTLLKNPLFGSHELHKLAALTMFKLSETITQLQSGEVKIDEILMDASLNNDLLGIDFTKMDRIEILNTIGLDKLFKDVIREQIFNADINERLQEDFDLADKAQVIYDNFDAFIRLGYQELINLENISVETEDALKETDKKKDEDGEDLTDEEVVALFGSTVEHWQVGFRQVSTFTSLSKLIRQELNRIYVLDKDGNRVTDEYGIEQNIDAHEAVSKILKWTQGATSIEDMLNKLDAKIPQEPWVQQLTDMLRADGNEQLRSQFFSNFKKYFQKYNIIYKEKTKTGTVTRVKTINRDPFVISTLDMISSLDNSKEMGSFNLWDARKGQIDSNAIKAIGFGVTSLEAMLNYKKSGWQMDSDLLQHHIEFIERALNYLNIPMPPRALLLQTLDSANVLSTLYNAVKGLYDTFKSVPVNKADYKFVNSKTQSNYTRIVEAFAPVMGDGLDSVSYEAGKLHYSYVTPSYLSKFVENMKGMRGDVKAFIESEYGNIEGWFRNRRNNTNQAGGEGWLNYWLDRMMGDTEEAKNTRNKFDHVVVLSDDGTAYVAKSPVQYMSSMLSMYFYDDHGASAYYRIPMMSNKPSEEYIKFDRIRDNFKEVITDWLVNKTYAQELNRIRAVNFRNNAPAELEALRKKVNDGKSLTDEEASRKAELEEIFKDGMPAKISGFDTNGATFMFMEYLNQYVADSNSELGRLLRKQINGEKFDESINESARFSELLREAVQSNLDSRFEGFLQNLAQEGLIQLSPSNEVIKVNTLQDKLPQSRAKGLLEEFFWNDMFASINLMQLLSTDIAYYKDTEDLQKRFAQWHSPGLRGDVNATINGKRVTDSKGCTRCMYIADRIEPSEIVETFKEVKQKVLSQERFANNPPAKALMEAQLDKIIDAFKDVNVTDAQAYTSPTGYRKKMAVFGQWSPRDEEVYQRVISGNFTADDLDVLWQPLKPFVYSQIEKRGFNPFMPTLKMGVQQKNSEYCIILADALMRSVGMESKLTAIFDFMEESHKRHPNKGIDTIMFNSAVKAGLMGVIDINDPNLSHDDVVNYLNSMAGMSQDDYDDRYVHTIPFDDYSIQQYNPAHFEGEQQAGSQNRVLVFADMPNEIDGKEQTIVVDGNKVSVKQAKINYFKAIIDNIRISADGIREEFALDSKSKQAKKIALMRVLQKEIAKDARYGTDLQWACLLDDTCNFNIPLSDAIQSDRIQQLLNSIIKNRINKQEIAGGPVVQVSNYGTSKDLKIVRNEDGTIKYFECYAPVYDPQLYEDFGDGKGGIDMEKIKRDNPKLLEMIGYRIPTEAKYSMAPLKIVGFLPRNAGEGIMLPKEITTLSGSDFDVDKMYIMRYKLDRHDNKEQVIKEIEDEYKAAKQNGRASRVRGLVEGTIKPTQESDHIILASWRQKHKLEYRNYTSGKYYNDNLIIATQWGILTSGMAEDQVLSSGNFDEVKRIGYMMAAMDNGTPYDSASTMSGSALKKAAYRNKYLQYADTQMQFHKQNMVAAKLIGVFAQANVSHAIVGMSDVPAEIEIPEGGSFSINGQSYFSGKRYIVDQEYGLDNATRISSVLAQLLAGSVDAVKDPVLNLLNINMDTVNIAVTLVRLGHDLEFIGLFLTHPIIKQLVSRYNIEKASGSTNSLMQTLVAMQKELQGEDGKGATLQMKYNYDKAFFVREHTNWTAVNDEQRKYKKDMDLTVLELFKKLNNMAEMFRGVVHTTRYNSITSAVGPYASDTMNNKIKDESFDANPFVTEELKSASEGMIYDEKGNTISLIRAFRDTSAKLERELLGENMIQASNATYEVYRALYRKMGYMSSKMAKEFGRFYMSYYMNMESPLFDLSDAHREEMLDKFPLEFVAKKNQYRDNPFVQAVILGKDKADNDLLTISTRGLTDSEIQALRSAWADLYTSEKEKGIADKDNLALKLVEYNFFLGSFGFSPKTFMSMTPNVVKLAISGYKDSLTREVVMSPDRIDNLLTQFMLNYGYANLGTLKEKDISFKSGDLVDKKEFDKEPTSAGIAKMQMNDGTTQWLYVEPITDSTDVKVYFVDKLGGNNQQCFEIDPSRKVYQIESIVKNVEPVSATEAEPDRGESVEPMVDDGRTVYQHLIPLLAAVKDGYIMDNPRQNMANLQDRFNKLYNAGQQSFISSVTGLNIATIDRVADVLGVTQDELLSDVNESQNKLNLCK